MGTPVPEIGTGMYVVSLTTATDAVDCTHAAAPVSDAALDELTALCPAPALDGKPEPSREQA